MKLTTGLENIKGVVNSMTFLSLQLVEIDKNYRLTLPRWNSLCHRLSRDQPQPGSFFQRPREAEKRDPGNEVDINKNNYLFFYFHFFCLQTFFLKLITDSCYATGSCTTPYF